MHLARRSDAEAALFLVRHALDLDATQWDALDLLEQLAPALERTELCRRYEAFLDEVPHGERAEAVRERLIERLLGYGHHYSALRHVDDLLAHLALRGPSDAQVDNARTTLLMEQPPRFDLASVDRELDGLEDVLLCEAAE